jgi:hypothetical protein
MEKLCAALPITIRAILRSLPDGSASAAINERNMSPAKVAIQLGHHFLVQGMRQG